MGEGGGGTREREMGRRWMREGGMKRGKKMRRALERDRQTDRQTDRQRQRKKKKKTTSELHYTVIKILGSCLFLQSVPATLHAKWLHIKQQ